jgi:hypothetical protein
MVCADESREIVRKSPTDAVPLYDRTVFAGAVSFAAELQPTKKQAIASSTNLAVFI